MTKTFISLPNLGSVNTRQRIGALLYTLTNCAEIYFMGV